ncbi:MAG: hypothetical protein ABSH06_29665 [Thermodesulfobacteriota bacterium]
MASCREALEFPKRSQPSPSMGGEREGVKKLESGLSPKFNANSKTTEIYTHVSTPKQRSEGERKEIKWLENTTFKRSILEKLISIQITLGMNQ